MNAPLTPAAGADAATFEESFARCDELIVGHLAAAHRRFGSAALGVIDLPPLGSEPIVAAQVRVAAALYMLRELERAGLVPTVEKLAESLSDGTLLLPVGAAVHELARIVRARDERISQGERERIFSQVFGAPSEAAPGDVALAGLAGALVALGRESVLHTVAHHRARVAMAARDLGTLLSNRAVGMAGFGAREMAAQVREAFDVLSDPEIRTSLGGGDPWTLVARQARRLLGREVLPHRNLQRGRAGLSIIKWVADSASDLDTASGALTRSHPVVQAAEAWQIAGGGS